MKASPTPTPPPGRRALAPLSLTRLSRIRSTHHPHCHACSNPDYRLKYATYDYDTLIARITPLQKLCSYDEILHGGVASLLIDEAMCCCLMAHGILGLTGELALRYRQPAGLAQPLEIHTRVTWARAPLYHLESQLLQNGKTMLTAKAKFMQRAEQPEPE